MVPQNDEDIFLRLGLRDGALSTDCRSKDAHDDKNKLFAPLNEVEWSKTHARFQGIHHDWD